MVHTSKERCRKAPVEKLPTAVKGEEEEREAKYYNEKEKFKAAFVDKIASLHGKTLAASSTWEKYRALAGVVSDQISRNWIVTDKRYADSGTKQVYYFSIEFLLGRMLGSNLLNLGIKDMCTAALQELDIELSKLEEQEEDAGLGNGGLGRLAACYLDSMASTQLPGHGCGIRYKYGLFEQKISDGYQQEYPDNWLNNGYAWEYRRPNEAVEVRFGGQVQMQVNGKIKYIHQDYEAILAVPYDVPVVGYQNQTVNTLRLWSAEAKLTELSCSAFNRNDCQKVIEYTHEVQTISNVLYPDDSHYEGKVLRLKQQYFMVSAGLQSIVQNYKAQHGQLHDFHKKVAIHINDTHPALAIPELMRLLLDEESLSWEEAWKITNQTMSYTNHTILPEALEKWPVDLFQSLLPRIYMIINEINEQYCQELWQQYPGEWARISTMAIIADGQVKMAHLAVVGSHSVNGVAKLHTHLLEQKVMNQFYQFYPEKFNNKTNGVTHRRWLMLANPELSELITGTIGPQWVEYPCHMTHLIKHAEDSSFQQEIARVKLHNKVNLAKYIKNHYGISVDVNSIFDVHIKRIHAYKRQSLNLLQIMDLYNRLRANPNLDIVPRTFIFGGKAAAGYYIAKHTIKLVHTLADLINNDLTIQNKIKVVFMENYNVSLAELIIPATDVSEQIPTASFEACGTGNMKFMMNGAVTIGTLDGANVEIKAAVGDKNIIMFGLTANEVLDYYKDGGYNPWDVYRSDPRVQTILEQLVNGFLPAGREEFRNHYDSFLNQGDHFFVLKDFAAYVDAQNQVDRLFKDRSTWLNMCIHNIAHSGKFSSDRTFTEYSMDIWKLHPDIPVRCDCPADNAFTAALNGCDRLNPTGISLQ
jgi:starch phosphorylase